MRAKYLQSVSGPALTAAAARECLAAAEAADRRHRGPATANRDPDAADLRREECSDGP